jgi:hypothetical protein
MQRRTRSISPITLIIFLIIFLAGDDVAATAPTRAITPAIRRLVSLAWANAVQCLPSRRVWASPPRAMAMNHQAA